MSPIPSRVPFGAKSSAQAGSLTKKPVSLLLMLLARPAWISKPSRASFMEGFTSSDHGSEA